MTMSEELSYPVDIAWNLLTVFFSKQTPVEDEQC